MGHRMRTILVVLILAGFAQGSRAESVLALSIGPDAQRYTAGQLLRRPSHGRVDDTGWVPLRRPMRPSGAAAPAGERGARFR